MFLPSPCWNYTSTESQHGQQESGATLAPNCWLNTDPSQLDPDWSGYAYLQLDYVQKEFDSPQSLYIGIDDCHTTDYYSRVDWYTYLIPSRTSISSKDESQQWSQAMIPIDVSVGEKGEIGVARRRLNLSCITRVALQWQTTEASNTSTVLLGNVTLVPRPAFKNDFPKLLKIDMQPPTAPVAPGFTGVYGTPYSDYSGYGTGPDVNIFENADRQHPTRLLRDWVSFESGIGLSLALPSDHYGVWLCMVDAGYWEYYQNFNTRSVLLEGKAVYNETMTETEFVAQYVFSSSFL